MFRIENGLKDRNDMARCLVEILDPTRKFFVNEKSGFDFGGFSAQYGPEATCLEGWSRMLWGVGPFLAGGFDWEHVDEFLEGLKTGPDKEGGYYWGEPTEWDQRFVEMASISLTFMIARERTWDKLSEKEQKNIYTWLDQINHHDFCKNNWLFFRILVNTAFEKLGLPYNEAQIEEDFSYIEALYESDGWYHDAVPFDMYNPWAFQYYGLVYYAMRKDKDPERCARIAERTKLFAKQYVAYFNEEGGCVPYGRSLAYRFASASFFSAAAFAGLELLPWGVMKGIVLRNLRWWLNQEIFDNGGILSVGYAYPNLIMDDNYNAPGSPYWSLKLFLCLALDENHPFWTSEELPLNNPKHMYLDCPKAIAMHTEDDDVIYLTNGQNTSFRMNQVAEKYGKFAYSINRGFTCSVGGHELQNMGADNTLMFTEKGEEYWRVKDTIDESYGNENILKGVWHPYDNVKVTTWLIPAGDWHVRIHEIESERELVAMEGGFCIKRFQKYEHEMDPVVTDNLSISYPWGSTTIRSLSDGREGVVDQPISNMSMMFPSVLIPCLRSDVRIGVNHLASIVGASKDPDQIRNIPSVTVASDWKSVTIDGKVIELS